MSATRIRKACLSFPSKTPIGLDQHAFRDIALLLDKALGSLGEIIRQCFVKLAIPTQSLLQLLVLLGKKNGGSRTIAILHTTYRLTMRLVSAHISQWDVNFAGKWDSALKGKFLLERMLRGPGIELAHSEGQFVIHFLWDMRKFYKRTWKGRRRAKRVNRLCKMNSEAQKLTMTGIHPVQIHGHTAQGASNAQVDAMCRNLKLGTVLGKTQACPITTVAWFFEVKRVPQTAARVEQISEWISMWRNCNVDTRRRIRRFWRKKAPMLAGNPRRCNQATGPISATIGSVLEAGWKPSSPGLWQSPDCSATLDGALFNKAQIIDSFSSDMEMQTWKAAARHSSSSVLERGIITDFAKKARSQLIKEGNFTTARALDFLVCGAINEPHLLADGSIPNQCLCVRCDQKVLATRKHELWECPGNTLINHTHT